MNSRVKKVNAKVKKRRKKMIKPPWKKNGGGRERKREVETNKEMNKMETEESKKTENKRQYK